MGPIDSRGGRRSGSRVVVFVVVAAGLLGALLLGPGVVYGTEKEPGNPEEENPTAEAPSDQTPEGPLSESEASEPTLDEPKPGEPTPDEPKPAEPGVREFFADLVGERWELRGEWTAGAFHRIKELTWGLDGQIVKVRTFAPDPEGDGWVIQSEGVRAPDASTDGWRFFEFDRGSRILSGSVGRTPDSIYYEYEYFVDGELRMVRDAWIRAGDDEYTFQVGIWGDGEWEKILIEARARPVQ